MTSSTPSAWINIRDFVQTSFSFAVRNVTTGIRLKDDLPPEIVELRDSGIQLKIPKKSAALGHFLHFLIKERVVPPAELPRPPKEIQVTGKIVHEEEFNADFKIVDLQFHQFNEREWNNFLTECSHRQRSVDALMRKIQG